MCIEKAKKIFSILLIEKVRSKRRRELSERTLLKQAWMKLVKCLLEVTM